MSSLSFRSSAIEDLPFYESILSDPEWIDNSGFRMEDFCTEEQRIKFITCHNPNDLKGVVINEQNEYISFCHFKYLGDKRYEICGGVDKHLLNKGFGMLSIVFCIDHLFKSRNCEEVLSVILETNRRSRRINTGVGFVEVGTKYYDVRKFIVHRLTSDAFYNNRITKQIAKRLL